MGKILLISALLVSQSLFQVGSGLDGKKVNTNEPVKKTNSLGVKLTAKSAVVLDRRTKKILFSKNETERLPMASLTKLMTVLLFLENSKNLNDRFVVPSFITSEGAIMDLRTGEEIAVKDLIYGALIASGNDAAESLANIGGSEKDFIAKMNKKAVELGFLNTHFTNTTGLDSRNHYSSVLDLAKMMDMVLNNKVVVEAMQTKEYDAYSLNTDQVHHIVNTNRLLRFDYPKVKGGKTGYTEAAGFCFAAFASDEKSNEIITVVLGSDLNGNQFQDTKALVDWTYKNYAWK